MRIAVVGAGISGLMAARLLDPTDEVTVFEAAPKVGGHVETVDVPRAGGTVAVDAGFIVFCEPHYAHFARLLTELGVPSRPTDMSFSVRDEKNPAWSWRCPAWRASSPSAKICSGPDTSPSRGTCSGSASAPRASSRRRETARWRSCSPPSVSTRSSASGIWSRSRARCGRRRRRWCGGSRRGTSSAPLYGRQPHTADP
ncbi:MAG: NAD(P)-binding protein [Myxococcaceae bacterium]|nr:NAD(P)-binding protein [Myxococcaceae bacterium]